MKLTVLLVARILFMVPFLMIGMHHFMMADKMVGMLPSWLPGGIVWIYLTGFFELAAAVAIITAIQIRLAGFLLCILLLAYVAFLHIPSMMSADPSTSMLGLIGVMKDTGLAGGALLLSHIYTKKKSA
ncbi:MAG: DoxX family membrane protein [Bacteroidetes bacterium]|nr:DoxX family membrane protein [Bacteroidota bacterium]